MNPADFPFLAPSQEQREDGGGRGDERGRGRGDGKNRGSGRKGKGRGNTEVIQPPPGFGMVSMFPNDGFDKMVPLERNKDEDFLSLIPAKQKKK
jgi:hypothetical protein